jgi:hypothetical protein
VKDHGDAAPSRGIIFTVIAPAAAADHYFVRQLSEMKNRAKLFMRHLSHKAALPRRSKTPRKADDRRGRLNIRMIRGP